MDCYMACTVYSVVNKNRAPVCPSPYSGYNPLIPPTIPVSVNDLGTHVTSCHGNSNAGFNTQYEVSGTCLCCTVM